MAKESDKNKNMETKKQDPERSISHREDRSLRDAFDGFFFEDNFFPEPFGSWRLPSLLSRVDEQWFPRIDVNEKEKEITVFADVPGVNPENIDIDVQGNRMTISGSTERETETNGNERPYRYERSYGSFRREFMLPSRVEEDHVKATYKDGVLTVTLPKMKGEKKNKIKIEKQ